MDEYDIETLISESLNLHADEAGEQIRIRTFAEADLLTRDAGLVLRMDDGSEFQVTIVRSR